MPDTNKTRKNTPADPKLPRLSRRQRDALLQPYRDRLRRLAHDHEQLKLTIANEIKFSAAMKRERDDAREALGRAERDHGAACNAIRGLMADHDKQVADLQARLNVAEQSARDLKSANHYIKTMEDANEMMSCKIAALEREALGRGESAGKVVQLKAENERLRDEIARMKGQIECERRGHADLAAERHRVVEYLAARLAIAAGMAAEVAS